MRRIRHMAPVVAALAALVPSCGPQIDESLIGVYSCGVGGLLLDGDGTYGFSLMGGVGDVDTPDASGIWRTDGEVFRIEDRGGDMACPEGQVGRYVWAKSDGALEFTLIEDECAGRQVLAACRPWVEH